MGDRANCIVLQNTYEENPPVWLYTHWDGSNLLAMVQKAIQHKQRWEDSPYLTRIIFDTMSAGHQGEETGFGISTSECDNNHHYVVVDPKRQEVRIEDLESRYVYHRWTFKEFCTTNLSDVNF